MSCGAVNESTYAMLRLRRPDGIRGLAFRMLSVSALAGQHHFFTNRVGRSPFKEEPVRKIDRSGVGVCPSDSDWMDRRCFLTGIQCCSTMNMEVMDWAYL